MDVLVTFVIWMLFVGLFVCAVVGYGCTILFINVVLKKLILDSRITQPILRNLVLVIAWLWPLWIAYAPLVFLIAFAYKGVRMLHEGYKSVPQSTGGAS